MDMEKGPLAGGMRPVVILAAAAMCGSWLAFLLLQTGSVWDEAEHAHVAWMMSQGKKPLVDFFQHHQPVLWDLLSLYYRVGLEGAGVLFWGRILVLLCGLASIWSLLALGRRRVGGQLALSRLAAVGVLIAVTVYLPSLFVSRPETIAAALMLAALALWNRNQTSTRTVIFAGLFAGAACFTSPRFLLMGGFFLVIGVHTIPRWGALLSGGVIFVLGYMLVAQIPPSHVIFNLQFSAYLQSIGDNPVGHPSAFWTTLAVVSTASMLPLALALDNLQRTRGLLLLANLLLVFLLCHKVAGLFRYQQAYAPFAVSIPVTTALLLARLKERNSGVMRMEAAAALLAVVALCMLRVSQPALGFTLLQEVRDRNALAEMIPQGRTVLLFTRKHPISVGDASFYGSPLFDARDRLCRAVMGFRGGVDLPPCNFIADIQATPPYLLDTWIGRAVDRKDLPVLEAWIREQYGPISSNMLGGDISSGVLAHSGAQVKF